MTKIFQPIEGEVGECGSAPSSLIPKIIHIVWVGDERKRPDNCIQTWRAHHPDWEVKIWGNESLKTHAWVNAKHMQAMWSSELNGVADMMRWEILYREGGFAVDADSICLRPLNEEWLKLEAFACWENEQVQPGLIAAGYFAARPNNPFVGQIIMDIYNAPTVTHAMAWKTVGPQRLTDTYNQHAYRGLTIFPSYTFIPEHFTGVRYTGDGLVYATQEWATTKRGYDVLHQKKIELPTVKASNTVQQDVEKSTIKEMAGEQKQSFEQKTGTTTNSPLEQQHAAFFVQKQSVQRNLIGRSRIEVFANLCQGKRVLHVGCADWPITHPETSLHLSLQKYCAQLDGFDIHEEALAQLRPFAQGALFSRLEDITAYYDLVLVPEVMGHVPNVQEFLAQLNKINTQKYVITVPDAYSCFSEHFDFVADTETFVEVVHPDHNCWYTPYTLNNVIRKYTTWHLEGMWFFNRISLLAIVSKSPSTDLFCSENDLMAVSTVSKEKSIEKNLNMKFSYIIAYRHSEERIKNLQLVLDWLGNSPTEIILVESDLESELEVLKDKYNFKHIFLKNNYPFNKSWCFNVGHKSAVTENIVFGDADLIMDKVKFLEAVSNLSEYEVVNPYRPVLDLTFEESQRYAFTKDFSDLSSISRPGRGETDHQKVPFCGGIIMFKKSCLESMAGWNEDFWGWGVEDDAQSYKVFTLEKKSLQCENKCYHLYHDRSAPDQQLYYRNFNVYKQFVQLDKQMMEKYVTSIKDKFGDINKLNK